MRNITKTVLAFALCLPLAGCKQGKTNVEPSTSYDTTVDAVLTTDEFVLNVLTPGASDAQWLNPDTYTLIKASYDGTGGYTMQSFHEFEMNDNGDLVSTTEDNISDEYSNGVVGPITFKDSDETVAELKFLDADMYEGKKQDIESNENITVTDSGMKGNAEYTAYTMSETDLTTYYYIVRIPDSQLSAMLESTRSEEALKEVFDGLTLEVYAE